MSKHLPGIVALSLTAIAPAQQENNAGFGGIYRKVDLLALTGNAGCVGCADLGGELYVSARDPSGGSAHRIYVISTAGTLVRTMNQPAVQGASAWGMRDLCTDGSAIAGGSEVGISIITPNGALATQWQGQPIAQPIAGAALAALGTIRGLTWVGSAAGGAGRFYAVNHESAIYEFGLDGAITGTFPNRGWSGAGLATDPNTGNLWIDAAPARGDIAELDRVGGTFALTGRRFAQARAGSFPGGLSEASPVAGVHAPWATRSNLVSIAQGAPDLLAVQRVDYLPGKAGQDEVRLAIGVNGLPLGPGPIDFGPLDTLDLQIVDPTGAGNGLPAWVLLNFPPESQQDALTDLSQFIPGFGLLQEFRSRHFANVGQPPANYVLFGHVVGGIGHLPLPPGFLVAAGDLIRAQVIHFEPANPQVFDATNEAWWLGDQAQTGVLVEAVGPDSFEKDTRTGFWRVRHLGGGTPAITAVTLDWTTAAIAGQQSVVFDVDQTGMADRFDGGNATAAGCLGTYRNGSATACGLDFAFAGNHVGACGGAGRNAGFSIDVGTAVAARRITFRFAGGAFVAGRTFEFDADTDGGCGVSGDAMAGLVVTVTLAGGAQRTGALAVDPKRPLRAFVRL